jgi:hypothetical protein
MHYRQWTHVVVSFHYDDSHANGFVKFAIDGVLDETSHWMPDFFVDQQQWRALENDAADDDERKLWIGTASGNKEVRERESFRGFVDDISLWNVSFADRRKLESFVWSSFAGIERGLVAFYCFDHSAGNALDASDNNLIAVAVGSPQYRELPVKPFVSTNPCW